uniref:Putative secreted protein n=1 Tax=Psorophora albipes TaxID=869069 RepID=T1DFP7_9DIPT
MDHSSKVLLCILGLFAACLHLPSVSLKAIEAVGTKETEIERQPFYSCLPGTTTRLDCNFCACVHGMLTCTMAVCKNDPRLQDRRAPTQTFGPQYNKTNTFEI